MTRVEVSRITFQAVNDYAKKLNDAYLSVSVKVLPLIKNANLFQLNFFPVLCVVKGLW